MAVDKFGIEIQRGDVIAFVDTYKDYPPILCVSDNGFTPQYTRLSYIYIYGDVVIHKTNFKTKHLIILNDEQIAGLINRIVNARMKYQEELINNDITQHSEEEIRENIQKLLDYSTQLKEER